MIIFPFHYIKMALSFNIKHLILIVTLLSATTFICKSEEDEDDQEAPQIEDPSIVIAKALLCFNDKYIYSSCDEAYRLTQSGNFNVPPEATDQYCNGPCLKETHLVLSCINNILSKFLFYNKASIQDIRATLSAGCSHTSERGDFNVAEHIQASRALKATSPVNVIMYMLVLLGYFSAVVWPLIVSI